MFEWTTEVIVIVCVCAVILLFVVSGVIACCIYVNKDNKDNNENKYEHKKKVIKKKETKPKLKVDRKHPETDVAPAYSDKLSRRIAFEYASRNSARGKRLGVNNKVDYERTPALAGPRLTRKGKKALEASVAGGGRQDGDDLTSKLPRRAYLKSEIGPSTTSKNANSIMNESKFAEKATEKGSVKKSAQNLRVKDNDSIHDKPPRPDSLRNEVEQQITKSTSKQNQNLTMTTKIQEGKGTQEYEISNRSSELLTINMTSNSGAIVSSEMQDTSVDNLNSVAPTATLLDKAR